MIFAETMTEAYCADDLPLLANSQAALKSLDTTKQSVSG